MTNITVSKLILKKYKFIIIKFINLLVVNGKKSKSEIFFLDILNFLYIKKKFPFLIFFYALKNISPLIKLKTIKIKGKSFQIPIPLKKYKQIIFGIKCLIKTCKNQKLKKKNFFFDILSKEIFLASQKKGDLIKKKQELHKNAKINRIFVNYKWFK
jgi:small subunit ribosomal protein S7